MNMDGVGDLRDRDRPEGGGSPPVAVVTLPKELGLVPPHGSIG